MVSVHSFEILNKILSDRVLVVKIVSTRVLVVKIVLRTRFPLLKNRNRRPDLASCMKIQCQSSLISARREHAEVNIVKPVPREIQDEDKSVTVMCYKIFLGSSF